MNSKVLIGLFFLMSGAVSLQASEENSIITVINSTPKDITVFFSPSRYVVLTPRETYVYKGPHESAIAAMFGNDRQNAAVFQRITEKNITLEVNESENPLKPRIALSDNDETMASREELESLVSSLRKKLEECKKVCNAEYGSQPRSSKKRKKQ